MKCALSTETMQRVRETDVLAENPPLSNFVLHKCHTNLLGFEASPPQREADSWAKVYLSNVRARS
jgi:hypothetical protein